MINAIGPTLALSVTQGWSWPFLTDARAGIIVLVREHDVLALGLHGFAFGLLGFAAVVAYLIAGPDGTAARASQLPTATSRPSTLAPTS